MANPEHVKILKQGVDVWNRWREENPEVVVDLVRTKLKGANLEGANLEEANLESVNLQKANLIRANLKGVNLQKAKLQGAYLSSANLKGANLERVDFSQASLVKAVLEGAYLERANLYGAYLGSANLKGAYCRETNFIEADLNRADLSRSDLSGAVLVDTILSFVVLDGANLKGVHLDEAALRGADLQGADLQEAKLCNTSLDDLDLSQTIGLETCKHGGSSTIGTDTLVKSKGKIPVEFLRGCGLSDWEIESAKLYQPGLSNEEVTDLIYKIHDIRTTQAIQINPLFISYSHEDGQFVDKMGQQLTQKGIRFWRDKEHGTAGRIDKQIDRAIRSHSVVLLILSEHATQSDWVEHEVEKAQELSKILGGKDVLCPIALDDSWKECNWSSKLKTQIRKYKIVDFSEWQDQDKFDKKFAKLLQGLDLFYK